MYTYNNDKEQRSPGGDRGDTEGVRGGRVFVGMI